MNTPTVHKSDQHPYGEQPLVHQTGINAPQSSNPNQNFLSRISNAPHFIFTCPLHRLSWLIPRRRVGPTSTWGKPRGVSTLFTLSKGGRERKASHFCKNVFSSASTSPSPTPAPAPAAVAPPIPFDGLSKTIGGGCLMVKISKSPRPPGFLSLLLFPFPSLFFSDGDELDDDLGNQACQLAATASPVTGSTRIRKRPL